MGLSTQRGARAWPAPVTSWQGRHCNCLHCGDGEAGYAPGESWSAGPARSRDGGIHKVPVGIGQRRSGSAGGKSILRQAAWAHHRAGHGESAGADPGHRGDPRPGGRQRGPRTWPRIQVGPQSCQLGVAGPGGRKACGGHGSGYFPWPESGHTRPLGRASQGGDAQGPVPQGFSGGPVPCCRRRHPVVRRTRQRCRAAKATQGGPLQAAHPAPFRLVPQNSGTEGSLKKWGLVSCPWCRHFTAAGGSLRGGGIVHGGPPCAVCRGSAHLRKAAQEMSAQLSEEAMAEATASSAAHSSGRDEGWGGGRVAGC